MPEAKNFFSKEEEQELVDAITAAEKNTSGEIRVHIENHTEKPPLERAKEVFHLLDMDTTTERNGVLFYVGVHDHTFAIIGDEGIDKLVESDFWDCTRDTVIDHFKAGNFKQGLAEGIARAGERLKIHFPFKDGDKNELPNEISNS